MKMYAAFDLHSNNSHLGVIDRDGKKIEGRKLPNDPRCILSALEPFRERIEAVAVESTYNWYWLVDLLMDNGYTARLANPAAIQRYSGLKYADDRHDAFWLAEMLRLGILPEGYIYPKQMRPIRDLLRKRGHLVRLRTSLIISLKSMITRQTGRTVSVNQVKALKRDQVTPLLAGEPHLTLSAETSKQTIDHLTRQIRVLENAVEKPARQVAGYERLHTLPGVAKILGLTIFLETGDIRRFAKVGNYASYCRKVPSSWTSNGKRKGAGNKKNGNKHLAWAFSEASEKARQVNDRAKRYYDRKMSGSNRMVAHAALAHKLARAAYFILRDEVGFNEDKAFS